MLCYYTDILYEKSGCKNYIANPEKYTIIKSTCFYICNVFNFNFYRINAIAIIFYLYNHELRCIDVLYSNRQLACSYTVFFAILNTDNTVRVD